MPRVIVALLAGLIFGAGLALSGMANPQKVLAFLDLGARLAKTLEALALGHGEEGPEGILITAKLNQSELAQLLGVTREAVNKQLKQFAQEGLISTKGSRILVLDATALSARGKIKEESA